MVRIRIDHELCEANAVCVGIYNYGYVPLPATMAACVSTPPVAASMTIAPR